MSQIKKIKVLKNLCWVILALGVVGIFLIWKQPLPFFKSTYQVGQSSRITPTRSFLTDYGADQLTQISFEFNADAQTQKKLIGDGLFFSTSDDVSRGITLDVSPNGQLIVASPYLLKWGNTKNYLDGQWHAVIIQAWNGHRLNAFIDGVLLPPMANSLGLSPSHVIHYEVGEIKLYPYDFFRNFQAENTRLVKN